MRYPQLVVLDPDGWIARQLAELAGESRWLVRGPRTCADALALAREPRATVLLVRVEPAEDKTDPFALVGDAHRLCPDVPVVAVSDVKLPDADRAAWSAVLLDLGARFVLFPPLAKAVMEDVVSGLMAAAVRRVVGGEPPPAPGPRTPPAPDDVIDLADEGLHG
ncbi:MAG: hypothetical protein JWO38_790 [Gemmataceae bacterium]|nr:hypothetical protein [Gemmataceae bacterium]